MSMILSGNLIERFGPQLPTPQVEQIRVHEDKIEVDLSLYFLLSGDDSGGAQKNQIESDLADLNVYACLVYGKPYAESVILEESNVFGELYEGSSTSGMSASYLKGAAETGMFTTGVDYTTDEAKAIMMEAGWDFDGEPGVTPGFLMPF